MPSTIILITGANSGVGLATSQVLISASEDFHVIMAGRSLEKLNNAKSEIEASGKEGQLTTVQLDVTDQKSVEQAVKFVEQKFGRLDVLINNAGVANPDEDIRSRMQKTLEVNVVGPAAVSSAFRPLLLQSTKPYSIYVSSVVGSLTLSTDPTSPVYRLPIANAESYRVSKAALNMLVVQESIEFESTGLKVFAMCPGFVRSGIRGDSEEARSGGGRAGDPKVSGETILSIVQGKRDADAGKFHHAGGIHPW